MPVRCSTRDWREAQRKDWEATALAAAAKNISGLFPWLFVDRNEAGGYGGVYNEYLFWSANDTTGKRSRDANLQLCSGLVPQEQMRSHQENRRIDTHPQWSIVAGSGQECPNTTAAVHCFLDGENATFTLCHHLQQWKRQPKQGGDARLETATTHSGGLFAECPQQTTPRGSFVESSSPGARNLTLCLPADDKSATGLWIYNSSYGRQPTARAECPHGTVPSGTFRPQSQPLYLPALDSYAEVLKAFNTNMPRKRSYTSYITVDPDEGAGRWKMWATGFEAMQNVNPSGKKSVGVRTSCANTNSSTTGKLHRHDRPDIECVELLARQGLIDIGNSNRHGDNRLRATTID